MGARALILALLMGAVPLRAAAQSDSTHHGPAPEARVLHELQDEVNWRKKVRVWTVEYGTLELWAPDLHERGFTFFRALLLQNPDSLRGMVEIPLPLYKVHRIDVRKGHGGVGAAVGAALGFVAGIPGSDQRDGWQLSLLFGGMGGLVGHLVGDAMHTWRPIYTVPRAERADVPRSAWTVEPALHLLGDVLSIGIKLR